MNLKDLDPDSVYPHITLLKYGLIFAVVFLAQYLFGTTVGLIITAIVLVMTFVFPYLMDKHYEWMRLD